jgi:hypothetical protein
MTVFEEPEEHTIAKEYLCTLLYGDYSSFTYHFESEKAEARAIKQFDRWVKDAQAGRDGHWTFPDDEEEYDNFERCEICNLMADCVTATFHPIKA